MQAMSAGVMRDQEGMGAFGPSQPESNGADFMTRDAQVTSVVVMRDEEGTSKGFGFVNFEDAEGAHKAVEALNGSDVEGKELYAGRAQKKGEREAELKAKCASLPNALVVPF